MQKKTKGVVYKAEVGSLMYAIVAMRADIAFAVSTVNHFISKAGSLLRMDVKRIMRYLKGSLDFKLCLKGKEIAFKEFCNVDWVGDANVWRYTMGIRVSYWRWSRFVKPTIALSMTEVEYMGTSH